MEFATWEPVYEAVLADFGFGREADERARDVLGEVVTDPYPLEDLRAVADGRTVAVAGGADRLTDEADLAVAREADAVFAAGAAAGRLVDAGIGVDAVVTDLDGDPERAVAFADEGVPVVAHAHGDNVGALQAYGPDLAEGAVVPITQAAPRGVVQNVGGFTDGDRAAFLADHLGAARLTFPGWAFEDETVGPLKAHKLVWAERLLYWLERRRGEEFAVLDGRRAAVDTSALPG
ncbi:MAG: 6-hydroxymethylpterin diphosphokinase MptE-like protein [Halosimplex sp.]